MTAMLPVANRELHILSLGAGVQSTTVYLLALDRCVGVLFDAAIFADTQEEPAAVYRHLDWLRSLDGPPILVRTAGKLGDDLLRGRNSTGQPYAASIPAFVKSEGDEREGRSRRQCTREYKIDIVERAIRRDVLGLAPKRRVPRNVVLHQYFGISTDEARRSVRVRARVEGIDPTTAQQDLFAGRPARVIPRRAHAHFPLLDLGWSRKDCLRYLATRVPHPVPRSACVFCPFHTDAEWLALRDTDPDGWRRAVEIDAALRDAHAAVGLGMRGKMYLHRSCLPLAEVELRPATSWVGFAAECEGGCGV